MDRMIEDLENLVVKLEKRNKNYKNLEVQYNEINANLDEEYEEYQCKKFLEEAKLELTESIRVIAHSVRKMDKEIDTKSKELASIVTEANVIYMNQCPN
uniref:Tubulin-specific chaperone A n=1 Tax=Parastrongyloides trichosuri TaxID=131310 RepID=A0A0N5A4U8_PARTI